MIDTCAFAKCSSLSTVFVPSSVDTLRRHSFQDCANLSRVVFEEGSRLCRFAASAFRGCPRLSSISIPEGLQRVFGAYEGILEVQVGATNVGRNGNEENAAIVEEPLDSGDRQ
jgi:hypothetical protein